MGSSKKSSNTMLALLEGGMWRMGIAVALLAALGVGLYFAWQRFGAAAVAQNRQITAESIHLNAQPPWITSNVAEQAMREGSLEQLSTFDRQAAVQVARAFELQPWVKRVVRVSKLPPARFEVEVDYRKPAAMVVIATESGTKLLPIDEETVILPSEDFMNLSDEKIRSFPRVYVSNTLPQGLPGMPWGDVRIAAAAEIAYLLGDTWSEWGLYRLHAVEQPAQRGIPAQVTYVLGTRSGSEIVWGSAPGKELPDESPVRVKLARLSAYIEQNGSLADLSAERMLDLRSPDLTPQAPRTARLRQVILP